MSTKIEPLSERKVLNAGLCALMSVDGTDLTPAIAARTSYRDFAEEKTAEQNENLVDYLIRKRHDTPVEFADATFYMVMPIFIARQLVRHRTASINEESLRYKEAREEVYIPCREECKYQSTTNKQGGNEEMSLKEASNVISIIAGNALQTHKDYETLLATGLSKELCRTVLPLGQYTAWYWKANLRNIFHLLGLRLDSHAQEQVRVYATAMAEMLKPYFPNTFAAWENHILNAVTFSADEMAILKSVLDMVDISTSIEQTESYDLLLEIAKDKGMRKSRAIEFVSKFNKEPIVIDTSISTIEKAEKEIDLFYSAKAPDSEAVNILAKLNEGPIVEEKEIDAQYDVNTNAVLAEIIDTSQQIVDMLVFNPAVNYREDTVKEDVKVELTNYGKEMLRRQTPVRISKAEFESIPAYITTTPTGKYNHKVYRSIGVNNDGDYPIIVEYALGDLYGQLTNKVTQVIYKVIIDDMIPYRSVVKEMKGDYGYSYYQFVNKVYNDVYAQYNVNEENKNIDYSHPFYKKDPYPYKEKTSKK